MKSNIKANSTKVTLFATVLLATCLFASSANAQSAFEGKFTLAQQAYWGHGGLPAGDYLLSVTTTGSPAMVIIRDAGNGKEVAMVAAQTREASTTGGSALFIGRRGKRRVIYSFRVAELGQVFIYDPALARGRGVEEASDTEKVPILQASK
jgi:hypothetical protein